MKQQLLHKWKQAGENYIQNYFLNNLFAEQEFYTPSTFLSWLKLPNTQNSQLIKIVKKPGLGVPAAPDFLLSRLLKKLASIPSLVLAPPAPALFSI